MFWLGFVAGFLLCAGLIAGVLLVAANSGVRDEDSPLAVGQKTHYHEGPNGE